MSVSYSSFFFMLFMYRPPVLEQLMDLFSFFRLSFSTLLSGLDECGITFPFIDSFTMTVTMIPLTICATFFALLLSRLWGVVDVCIVKWRGGGHTKMRPDHDRDFSHAIHISNTIIFIVYPSVCARTFAAFTCKTIEGVHYLDQDYSIVCWQGQHVPIVLAALFSLIFFVVGVPLGTFLILRKHKDQLFDEHSKNYIMLQEKYGMLFKQCKIPKKSLSCVCRCCLFGTDLHVFCIFIYLFIF